MSTADRIKKLFKDQHGFDETALTPETTIQSLGLDSLDKIEFIFALEDEFKIKVPEGEVNMTTLQDVVDLVDQLLPENRKVAGA